MSSYIYKIYIRILGTKTLQCLRFIIQHVGMWVKSLIGLIYNKKDFYAIIYFSQTFYQILLLILSIIYIVNEIATMYNFVLCVNENKNKGKADESL